MPDFDAETLWELPDTDAVRQHRALNLYHILGRQADLFVVHK